MERPIDTVNLTEEMFLNLMKGKDIWIIVNAHDPKKSREFRFRGPFDGVFLTHAEISEIQYNSEMGIMNFLQRIKNDSKTYDVKSEEEKKNGNSSNGK